MRLKTIEVYTAKELKESFPKGFLKAYHNFQECNYYWYENVYEDASEIGLKILSFDCGRGNDIDGNFIISATDCAEKIIKNHGETCKIASDFIKKHQDIKEDDFEYYSEYEEKIGECDEDFLDEILKYYLKNLKEELEYTSTEDYFLEATESNEYEYDKFGRIF